MKVPYTILWVSSLGLGAHPPPLQLCLVGTVSHVPGALSRLVRQQKKIGQVDLAVFPPSLQARHLQQYSPRRSWCARVLFVWRGAADLAAEVYEVIDDTAHNVSSMLQDVRSFHCARLP